MSIRGVVIGIVLLILIRDVSADTIVVGTPGQIGAAYFGAAVGKGASLLQGRVAPLQEGPHIRRQRPV